MNRCFDHAIPSILKEVIRVEPEDVQKFVLAHSGHGGADVVLEVAGSPETFRMAWQCARPNATVTIVALYDEAQTLPLPEMYGKNLIFKTGGVDGCKCAETLALIEQGKIDTTPLITHTFPLKDIAAAYDLFENRRDGVIKAAIQMEGGIMFLDKCQPLGIFFTDYHLFRPLQQDA